MTVRRDSVLFATELFPLQNHLKPLFTVVWLFIFFFFSFIWSLFFAVYLFHLYIMKTKLLNLNFSLCSQFSVFQQPFLCIF